MKTNVSDFHSYCSLVGGFTLFGFGIIKKSNTAIFLGSMRIATGVTKWCPIMSLLNLTANNDCEFAEEEVTEVPKPLHEL